MQPIRRTGAARRNHDDLRPRRAIAAAQAALERSAFLGDFQPGSDRALRDFRAGFSHSAAGALGTCDYRRSYEARTAPASRGGGGHPPARAAARVSALNWLPGSPAALRKSRSMTL